MSEFSIKDIELLTGIKAHTLRMWEQRYDLLHPKRTPTNIRYYDDEDLKYLLNISILNRHGHKISEITRLCNDEIRSLAFSYSLHSADHPVHIQSLVAAMFNFDEAAFDKVLSTCILQSGLERTVTDVIFPFLQTVGTLWMADSVNASYEHFASNIIRQKLVVAIDGQHYQPEASRKRFLLFLPEGENHEIGLLFANFMIRFAGHSTLYLGKNMPLNDLPLAFEKFRPDYVFTSMTTACGDGMVQQCIEKIARHCPGAQILITGKFCIEQLGSEPGQVQLIRCTDDLKKLF